MRPSWLINALHFQLAWFAAALLTKHSAIIISIILFLHFVQIDKKLLDIKLLILAPIGWLLDLLLIQFSIVTTHNGWPPIWLMLLWCLLIMSLNHSLHWLTKLKGYWLAIIGAISGSSSYMAAMKFGALHSPLPWLEQLLYFALSWALFLPLLVHLKNKLSTPHHHTT